MLCVVYTCPSVFSITSTSLDVTESCLEQEAALQLHTGWRDPDVPSEYLQDTITSDEQVSYNFKKSCSE